MVLTLMLGLLVGLTGRLETWAAPMGLDFQAKEIGLADTSGEVHTLAGSLAKGPLVVLFYRGQWNIHCRETLISVGQKFERLRTLGANVIAISAEDPSVSRDFIEAQKLPFPLLSDPDLEVSRQWGVVMEESTVAKPAAYVLSQTGHVAFRHVSEYLGDTADLDAVVKAVIELSKR